MKGTKVNEDPIVALYQDFHRRLDKLRHQIDDEVLGRLGAEYIELLRDGERSMDEVIAELTDKALRWQSKRQHSEQCEYFNTAETVASRPGVTVLEACHVMAKHYYLQHHQVKGEQQLLSSKYDALFDSHYAEQIRLRQIKAAKELFGE